MLYKLLNKVTVFLLKIDNSFNYWAVSISILCTIVFLVNGEFQIHNFALFISFLLFIISLKYIGDNIKNKRIFYWFPVVIMVAYFPVLIELIHHYNPSISLRNNIGEKALELICNNRFCEILFPLLMAGYIDFCYQKGIHIKNIKVHIFSIIFIGTIIGSTFVEGICYSEYEKHNKIENTYKNLFLFLQLDLLWLITVYMLYLKSKSEE